MKLTIKKGSKKFKNEQVLNNISLEFEANKIYAIVGENGSGKTLLLRALIGLMKLNEGEVKLNDITIGKDQDFYLI